MKKVNYYRKANLCRCGKEKLVSSKRCKECFSVGNHRGLAKSYKTVGNELVSRNTSRSRCKRTFNQSGEGHRMRCDGCSEVLRSKGIVYHKGKFLCSQCLQRLPATKLQMKCARYLSDERYDFPIKRKLIKKLNEDKPKIE